MNNQLETIATLALCAMFLPGVGLAQGEVQGGKGKAGTEQDPATEKERAARGAAMMKSFLATLAKEGIKIDRKQGTLTLPVVMNAPTNELEFLLIHRIGKSHEALLVTNAKPSVLAAGLLAIGAEKGRNASFKKKVPEPTPAELKKGVDPFDLVQPEGKNLWMTVAFKTAEGKDVQLPVEELLRDWETNFSVIDNQWIFLGGRTDKIYRNEPPVFMADYEGNLISTCYKFPDNHLLTIAHERARDEMNWSKTDRCPPPGTRMWLTFHTRKPVIVAAREMKRRKEADERRRKGVKLDPGARPERNPARPDQAPPKKLPPKKAPPKSPPPKKGSVEGEKKDG